MEKNQTLEVIKELGRWAILLVVAEVITQTLEQVVKIPESLTFMVWAFEYTIPARMLFQFGLTALGRWIDRMIHTSTTIKANGLLPF